MKVIRELHKGGDRSCMHVEMDITDSRLSYVAGDHVAMFPVNDPQIVERIGELLGVDLDTVSTLTNTDSKLGLMHGINVALIPDSGIRTRSLKCTFLSQLPCRCTHAYTHTLRICL